MPPKMAILLGALALVWLILRLYTRRAEEKRVLEHEERMARLLAERDELLRVRSQPPATPRDESRSSGDDQCS